MYGYTAEEAVGKPITLIIPPERRSEQEEILSKVKKGIHINHFETVRLRKDGRRVTISLTISPIKDTSGNLLGASKIARDITEQKKAEEQLHFHAAIIQSIHDAVIGTDADIRIISWNQGAQDLYGWKESEALGKLARDFLPTAFLSPQDEQEWQEALSSKGYWTGEVTQTRKGGTLIPVLTSLAVVKDRKGTILGTVAVNRDITERKQLEQRKDDFIALAAHELRTPVTSLKLVIQALQRRSQQSGDTHSVLSLGTVDRQVKKLDELITSLLDVSRVQQGKLEYKKEVFPIDDFLKETVEHVQRVSPSHTIVFEGITNKQVIGDRDRIGQVLINLLTNAMKYSPQANQVIVSVKQKNASVLVSVTDFGIGIQKGQQEKIFDRFFQVNSQTGKTSPGLGLGLYISKEIIEQHHGKLWVESEEGKGAMFSFTLPVFIPENSAEKDAQHG
jgi:PAS domain S-box-containing protein